MKIFATIMLSGIMSLGLYAIYDATMKERAAEEVQAQHAEHCRQVNVLIIAEFDAIVAGGKFPTDTQQDRWRQLSVQCKEGE